MFLVQYSVCGHLWIHEAGGPEPSPTSCGVAQRFVHLVSSKLTETSKYHDNLRPRISICIHESVVSTSLQTLQHPLILSDSSSNATRLKQSPALSLVNVLTGFFNTTRTINLQGYCEFSLYTTVQSQIIRIL